MKKTHLVSAAFLVGAALALGSCGEATKGFNANADYEIVLPTDGTVAIPTGFVNYIYPIRVSVPSTESPAIGTSKGISIPANDVQLFLNCFICDFFDSPTGPRIPDTTDLSKYVQVSNPYIVKTDDNGQFTILVRLQAPSTYGVDSYKAQIGAASGSVNVVGTISVSSK